MDILKPRDEPRCQIAITFKTEREPIAGYMPVREYRRMKKDYLKGTEKGIYEFILEGHVAEKPVPLQDIDTFTMLPDIPE